MVFQGDVQRSGQATLACDQSGCLSHQSVSRCEQAVYLMQRDSLVIPLAFPEPISALRLTIVGDPLPPTTPDVPCMGRGERGGGSPGSLLCCLYTRGRRRRCYTDRKEQRHYSTQHDKINAFLDSRVTHSMSFPF